MESRPETLLVRQHERVKCNLRVQVSAAPEHAGQVRLARTLGDGSRIVSATLTDCSPGGLGIDSPVYFPKAARLDIRVFVSRPDASAETVLFQGIMRVQRASMFGHEPSYYLGTSFTDPPSQDQVASLMEQARRHPAAERAGKGDAVA